MNLKEAKDELQRACDHIYNVEQTMDINCSIVRREGYRVRLAIAEWENHLRELTLNDNNKTIDEL